jgi:hypothetical protein
MSGRSNSRVYCIFKKCMEVDTRDIKEHSKLAYDSGVPKIFFGGGGSTNSVEDKRQTERGSRGGSPLVGGSTQSANEWKSYSDYVVTDVYSMELGIWLRFVKTSEFRGVSNPPSR